MKNLILITLLCSIIGLFGTYSQQINASFGFDDAIDLKENNDYVRIIGADHSGFYVLRIDERDDLFLEYFCGTSKARQQANPLMLPIVDGLQSNYVEMFYINRKLVLLTEVIDNTAREKSLYIQNVNENGQIEGQPKIIGRLTGQNINADFNVKLTGDQQNIFVYYQSVFQTYNEEPFFYKVYDADLNEVYNHRIRIPMLKEEAFEIMQTEISSSGDIMLLAQVSPDERRAARMRHIVYDYKFLVFNPGNQTLRDFDISANRYELQDVMFGENGSGSVNFYGFMARRNRTDYEGIYHQRLDLQSGEFDRRGGRDAYYVFERHEQPIFRAERLMEIREEQFNYELVDVVHLSNGGSAVIAEHRNHWTDSTIVPGSREIIYYDYYKYNDILVGYTNPDNEMEWMVRIPKDQWSVNDLGMYSSFAHAVDGERIVFFYNEHRRNIRNLDRGELDGQEYRQLRHPERNGRAAFVSVFSDGQVQGGELFRGGNRGNIILPELLQKFNDKYYVYTQPRRTNFKFASFILL